MTMNELRIGNYFHPCFWSNGGNGKQRILLPDESKIFRVGELLFSGVRVIDPHRPDSPIFQYVETVSVKITLELLEKCGFEKINHIHGYSFYSLKGKNEPKIHIYENKTEWMGSYVPQHCKYLHQLQNLYFALTGQELEVKL